MKDNFSSQSAGYVRYRPVYPQQLYDFIFQHIADKQAAWDCGTGNGQAAKELAKVFDKVYATDISPKQIENAIRDDNIFYSVQQAERTNFPDNSFDLITVAQALHWFRFDDFYSELKRVAKPNAVFAAWTYSLLRISNEIDSLIGEHHFNILGNYWDAERKYVDEEYRNIPFPFTKINTPFFSIEYEWTTEELEGYLNTWSGLQKFIAANQYNPVDELMIRIKPFWKQEKMQIRFPVHLLIGRIENKSKASLTFANQIGLYKKNTPFTDKHIALGAKMAEFAGYNMPISYTGINDEHAAVRKNSGVFDVSHMGEFILKGENALDLIQRVTSNDAAKLKNGQAQYSCLPNEKGGIVDDLLVYCIEENKVYMLVVNASNIEKDWNWISKHNTKNVEMHNISGKTCLLAIQGPNATKILQTLTDIDILNLKYYTFVKGEFAGVKNVLISATGYTGAGGVEIYFENKDGDANKIWDAIFKAGEALGIKPVGLGARDTLRLEMGFCLYGNDIDDSSSPLEAGLGWITKFSKEFTSREEFEKQKAAGVERKLVGFEMIDKGIPRHGYEIKDYTGATIGVVTSGTQSPSLNKAIGMGYVRTPYAAIDSNIFIKVRDKLLQAKVVKMPFS